MKIIFKGIKLTVIHAPVLGYDFTLGFVSRSIAIDDEEIRYLITWKNSSDFFTPDLVQKIEEIIWH